MVFSKTFTVQKAVKVFFISLTGEKQNEILLRRKRSGPQLAEQLRYGTELFRGGKAPRGEREEQAGGA
jgi:hypothetical protein